MALPGGAKRHPSRVRHRWAILTYGLGCIARAHHLEGVGVPKGTSPGGNRWGILSRMWQLGTLDRRTPGAGLLGPLNATAYVAWLAVASSLLSPAGSQTIGSVPWVAGLAALVLFLITLGTRAILEEHCASDAWLSRTVILQAVIAPISLWTLQDHLQAVLLVLVASQLAALRDRRISLAALALANGALFAWLARSEPLAKAMQLGLAYVAFQLFAAFVSRAAYVAEESRRDVLRANRELQAARALVAEGARAQERLRLSRELHDIAGHKLTALKLQLSLEMRTQGASASGTLTQCLTLADELLTDIRTVVSALRQEDTIDLRTALLALNPAVASVSVQFNIEPGAIVADIAKAEAFLRCAQEGLTNALRHGGATEILITLSRNDEELVLSVEDNGAGYSSPAPTAGNGLRGLRERLEEFQGVVSLDRRTPRGCVLRAVMPEPRTTC
jgi:signal transduction histidine kinase